MRLHAIQTGTVVIKARPRDDTNGSGWVRLFKTLRNRIWTDPLPVYAWVIEHPEGLIVIDTSQLPPVATAIYYPWWHPHYQLGVQAALTPKDGIEARLARLGLAARDVRWVILTHLHADHAGGLHVFPQAEFVVTRREYTAASNGQVNGYLRQQWPTRFRPRLITHNAGPHGPFPHSQTLTEAGDVILVPTPGHTVGHQSVILHTSDITYLFAGDTTLTEQHLLDQIVDSVPQDAAAARRSLARTLAFVQQQPTVYLPSHDPGAAQRLADRQITGIAQGQ